MSGKPSEYDWEVLKQIDTWLAKRDTWSRKFARLANKPLDKAGQLLLESPVLGDAIKKAFQGLLGMLNDFAQWSISTESICNSYRKDGHQVVTLYGVAQLPLEAMDKRARWLSTKYATLASLEGGGAGMLGPAGIVADIPAVLAINLRAIGHYAAVYGFDIHDQRERMFALSILGADGVDDVEGQAAKTATLAELRKIAVEISKKKTWKQLEENAFVKIAQAIAKALGQRLTKAKLGQIIPGVAIAVGAGVNAQFTRATCHRAFMIYRERRLMEKYPEIRDRRARTIG